MRIYYPSIITETEVDLMALKTNNATQFGIVDINGKKIGLSWSTINPPDVLEVADFQIVAIGHWTEFILVSVIDCEVLMKFGLDFALVTIEKYGYCLFVVTELNVLCVNLYSNSIFKVVGLPEIADKIEFRDQELTVYCIDGTVVTKKI